MRPRRPCLRHRLHPDERTSGMLMDVKYGSTAPGVPVVQWPSHNGANQQWLLTRTGSGAFTIRSANSGLCLDTPAPQSSTRQLVQNPCDGSGNQQWKNPDRRRRLQPCQRRQRPGRRQQAVVG
ncbi:RICIN domain-containing protein [Streptomyces sp. NPDC052236]|uniref:RICIN domain-containing protein n=1 Tax=Streptomyces sp. NPDC052236 TaxID=3365686 RepID=UPI0037D44D0B